MSAILYIAIAAAIALFVYLIVFRRSSGSPKSDPSIFAATVYHESHYYDTTPDGVDVFSYQRRHRPEALDDIDEGCQQTFDIARERYGYTIDLDHTAFWASLWPRSNKCEGAGFLMQYRPVGSDGYDQGPSDKNPTPGIVELCVAGAFMVKYEGPDTGSPSHLAIALVDDPSMTEIAARYESEHGVILRNDPDLYNRTWDHSQGGGHPILKVNGEGVYVGLHGGPVFVCGCSPVEIDGKLYEPVQKEIFFGG